MEDTSFHLQWLKGQCMSVPGWLHKSKGDFIFWQEESMNGKKPEGVWGEEQRESNIFPHKKPINFLQYLQKMTKI